MDLRALINLVPSIARQPLLELLGRLERLERQVADLQAARGTLSIDLPANKEQRS